MDIELKEILLSMQGEMRAMREDLTEVKADLSEVKQRVAKIEATTENIEQAIERAGTKAGNKGYDCALGAIEMVNLIKEIEK